MEEDFDREIKVVVLGNGGVGKTSMIRRFCKGVFTDEYKKTIGVDFLEKAHFVDALQEEVRFMVWDTGAWMMGGGCFLLPPQPPGTQVYLTLVGAAAPFFWGPASRILTSRAWCLPCCPPFAAGQEEFDAITRTYYRGAGAAVIAFSTTDLDSFKAVASWKEKIMAECGEIAMCLVQNKVDLIDRAVASADEVEATARKMGLKLYRTCVKENINVSEVFQYLAELHTKKLAAGVLNQQPTAQAITGPSGMHVTNEQQVDEEGYVQRQPGDLPMTVELGPSKKRTKGKKSFKDKMTACNVA